MTFHIYNDVEQGTEEWEQLRCGLLTASQIGKLITPTLGIADNETSRALTETIVAERISGRVEPVHPTRDMERGTLDEPYARDIYRQQHGPVEEIGFATNTFNGHTLGASPDGLIGADGGLEIKAPRQKNHLHTILNNSVPAEYLPQVHANMLVTGREWWDFCTYCGGWPIHVIRVQRDLWWDKAILAALDKFEHSAAQMIAAYRNRVGDATIAPRIDHYLEVELKL